MLFPHMLGPVMTWKLASMGMADMSLGTSSVPRSSILSKMGCLELLICIQGPNLGRTYPGDEDTSAKLQIKSKLLMASLSLKIEPIFSLNEIISSSTITLLMSVISLKAFCPCWSLKSMEVEKRLSFHFQKI